MIITFWDEQVIKSACAGQHVVLRSDRPFDGLMGRRYGLEVRDTLLVLSCEGLSFAFLCRKPLDGTVCNNVLRYGTGGLWIDGCRIHGFDAEAGRVRHGGGIVGNASSYELPDKGEPMPAGRWPTNLVLIHTSECKRDKFETVPAWDCQEGCAVKALDQQGIERGIHSAGSLNSGFGRRTNQNMSMFAGDHEGNGMRFGDEGGASRFYPQFSNQQEFEAWIDRLLGGTKDK